jgi:pimeloyl-ACP methyl ester carboxylesterase
MKHTNSTPSIAFDDQGRGEPSLLCLPGWCVDKTSFRYLVEAGSRNRRTLAMDWRGHGESAPEQGDFGESALIEDVLSVIEDSGCRKLFPLRLHTRGGLQSN